MDNAGLYNHSFRALAEKAGIGTSTVTGLVYGRRQSDEQTIKAVADALRLKVTTIRAWASQALGQENPFELPPEANRLTRRQREAVRAIVSAMLDPGEGEPPEPDLSKVQGMRLAEDSPALRAVDDDRR